MGNCSLPYTLHDISGTTSYPYSYSSPAAFPDSVPVINDDLAASTAALNAPAPADFRLLACAPGKRDRQDRLRKELEPISRNTALET
jgi:hypothetical protein